MTDDEQRVVAVIAADLEAMTELAALRTLGLPDAWLAAGFVRNRVWDHLSGIVPAHPQSDVDVVYFDTADPDGARESEHETALRKLVPRTPWQVRNQARMHLRHGDAPYRDVADGMRRWLETATAVGVRLAADGRIEMLAPYGPGDLLGLVCRPTAAGRERPDAYRARVEGKRWRTRWPRLTVIEPRC